MQQAFSSLPKGVPRKQHDIGSVSWLSSRIWKFGSLSQLLVEIVIHSLFYQRLDTECLIHCSVKICRQRAIPSQS